MALGQKYQINKHDRHDIAWTTKIYEEGYAGEITYFVAADAEPAQINDCNESDDPIDPIKDKRFYLNVFSTSMFGLADFYSAEEMVLWAEVYQGLSLYMAGWVDPGEYEEAYGPAPYIARICIVDGLSILPKLKYEASEGVPYNGHKYESAIIRDILEKIGFTTFREYVNVYETNMDSGVSDSPFDQCMLNTDVFSDNEMYCDEVLKEILKSYGACIRQQGGVFNIYRPRELTGATVYGRYFTGDTTKTAISFTPAQYIKRTGYATTYHQMPGSRTMIQRPIRKVIIKQDYGYKDSWLDNWKFEPDTFDGTTFQHWIKDAGLVVGPVKEIIATEENGIFIDNYNSTTGTIRQAFAHNAVVTSSGNDKFYLEFKYLIYNPTASTIASITLNFRLYSSISGASLHPGPNLDDGFWTTGNFTLIETNIDPGVTAWKTFKTQVPTGLPDTGPYWMEITKPTSSSNFYLCVQDIKTGVVSGDLVILTRTQSMFIRGSQRRTSPSTMMLSPRNLATIEIKETLGRTYEKTNSINGDENEYQCSIGDIIGSNIDNIIEQFAGAKAIIASLASAAAAFVTAHAADYSGGGVNVTSISRRIRFTSAVAGTDFTGNTTIANFDGDLSGSVSNVQANSPATNRRDKITLSGTFGGGFINCVSDTGAVYNADCTFVGSLSATAQSFVLNYEYDFALEGFTLTYSGADIIVELDSGENLYLSFLNYDGNLDGTVSTVTSYSAGQARIDEIYLIGISGTANITCDGVTEEIENAITPSSTWNTRGGAEAAPLLQIVCDEIALMRSRPRQFVDMIIQEQTKAATNLNLLGNFQDIINIFGTNMRAFIVNRGTFNIKSRTWKLDLIEIGEGDVVSESTTADSTDVTADNNIITVDSN